MEAGVMPKMFFIDSVTPQVAWFFSFAMPRASQMNCCFSASNWASSPAETA